MPKQKPANLLLETLKARYARATDKLERQELRRRIREVAAMLAQAEYELKAEAVRRDIAGAY